MFGRQEIARSPAAFFSFMPTENTTMETKKMIFFAEKFGKSKKKP
jgi:hypothetical protein